MPRPRWIPPVGVSHGRAPGSTGTAAPSAYHPRVERLGSVPRAVLTFVLLGLVVLLLVGVTGVLVLGDSRRTEPSHRRVTSRPPTASVVERQLDDGLLTGDADSGAWRSRAS